MIKLCLSSMWCFVLIFAEQSVQMQLFPFFYSGLNDMTYQASKLRIEHNNS